MSIEDRRRSVYPGVTPRGTSESRLPPVQSTARSSEKRRCSGDSVNNAESQRTDYKRARSQGFVPSPDGHPAINSIEQPAGPVEAKSTGRPKADAAAKTSLHRTTPLKSKRALNDTDVGVPDAAGHTIKRARNDRYVGNPKGAEHTTKRAQNDKDVGNPKGAEHTTKRLRNDKDVGDPKGESHTTKRTRKDSPARDESPAPAIGDVPANMLEIKQAAPLDLPADQKQVSEESADRAIPNAPEHSGKSGCVQTGNDKVKVPDISTVQEDTAAKGDAEKTSLSVDDVTANAASGSQHVETSTKGQDEVKPDGELKNVQHCDDPVVSAARSQQLPEEASVNQEPMIHNGLKMTGQLCYQNSTFQSLGNLIGMRESLMSPVSSPDDVSSLAELERLCNSAHTSRQASSARKRLREAIRCHSGLLCVSCPQYPLSILLLTFDRSMTSQACKIFEGMRSESGDGAPSSAKFAAEALACLTNIKEYNGESQQDANEFQGVLLDQLEDEENVQVQLGQKDSKSLYNLFRGNQTDFVSSSTMYRRLAGFC